MLLTKCIVCLTDEERTELDDLIRTSQRRWASAWADG